MGNNSENKSLVLRSNNRGLSTSTTNPLAKAAGIIAQATADVDVAYYAANVWGRVKMVEADAIIKHGLLK